MFGMVVIWGRHLKVKNLDNFNIITSRGTRNGYCANIGCRRDVCNFIFKYKVDYSSKYSKFYYTLFTNGGHDINFKIGGSKLYYLSYDTKSFLNDGILEGLSTTDILDNNSTFRKGKINVYNEINYKLSDLVIKNRRYHNQLKKNGTYKATFEKGVLSFKKRSFKYLRLIYYDEENLNTTFLVYDNVLYSKFKDINQIYIDGTFKKKFFFSVNVPGSLRTIPISFTIFKGRAVEYQLTWKSFKKVLEKNLCLDYCSLISDLGSAERKFCIIEPSLRLLKYVLCWFHTFNKFFLPRIRRVKNKNIIRYIKSTIRAIYSAKTFDIRDVAIKKLREIIGEKNYLRIILMIIW
jgi:hypothetical protein